MAAEDHDDVHDVPDHHDHDHDGSGFRAWLTSLYHPHSHDASDSLDASLESSARGIRAVKVSLVGLLVTALLQILVVVLTGSVALLADTIHNFSDALTSIPLWIAFVLGRRAASRSYTYGYRRAEDLSGLFIVAMIAFSAVLAAWESIDRLMDPRPVENVGLLALAGFIGFLGNEAVAIYRIRIGTEIGSAALVADGQHARTDGLTSLAVLFGAIGVWLGFPIVDPIIGLLITVAILFVLRDAARRVFRRLMDAVEPELVDHIEEVVTEVEGVEGVDAVRARWVGHRLDASLHVLVDPDMSVLAGHVIAEDVRHALFHAIDKLDEVTIHVDPVGEQHHESTRHHLDRGVGRSEGAI
jgi:cation diffusion facilitator family transporter